MANIKEVAALAGVSTTTVSHVINETRFVAEETRERVFAAMRDLNYAPSLVARSLKVKETNSIGMLVTTSSNPFFAEVVRGGALLLRAGLQPDAGQHRRTGRDGALLPQDDAQETGRRPAHHVQRGQQEVFNQLDWLKSLPVVVMDWGMENDEVDLIADNPIAAATWQPAICWGWVTLPSVASRDPTAAPRPTSARRVSSKRCRRPGSPSIRAGSRRETLTAPAAPPP
jgi:LacI family transcriptional regulator